MHKKIGIIIFACIIIALPILTLVKPVSYTHLTLPTN